MIYDGIIMAHKTITCTKPAKAERSHKCQGEA